MSISAYSSVTLKTNVDNIEAYWIKLSTVLIFIFLDFIGLMVT